jgi:hypothetical protein
MFEPKWKQKVEPYQAVRGIQIAIASYVTDAAASDKSLETITEELAVAVGSAEAFRITQQRVAPSRNARLAASQKVSA